MRKTKFLAVALCLDAALVASALAQISPNLHSVLVSADVQPDPPQILLHWPGDTNATGYAVSRKSPSDLAWTALAAVPPNANAYRDTAVSASSAYEYQIIKTTAAGYTGYGYICAGIQAPLVEQHGKVVLVVANTYAADLASELAQLQQDLVGDGWMVLRHDVSPLDSVADVKALIQADYDADPDNVEAVFLFGAVPVPYSGAIAPDGHTNHFGAWPADVYYADMHGLWTDSLVTATNAERTVNWNVPGDGKFDQSTPPAPVSLQIGRVDLSNMTCFSNKTPSRSEKDLLRQYLLKDHNFRHGLLPVGRRGLICDNFPDKGDDPVAGSGWRNFSGFFGADNIVEVGWTNYFPAVTARRSYLWTFASGGGQYYTCTGVGSSDDFALQDIRVVFSMWLGSRFGDWDNESNFLRAPLGSTSYTLTSSYSGFPQWLYHPMALGQTAGFCARLTQNNRPGGLYPPFNQGTNQVHIALLGDPTLRMHPVVPPSQLATVTTSAGVTLSWRASPDSDLLGYHVYRAAGPSGPFARLTGPGPLTQLSFTDQPPLGTYTYMVRAIKLERSASGTYLNASQGVFVSADTWPGSGGLMLSASRADPPAILIRVIGHVGDQFAIEVSPDLHEWTGLFTNRVTSAGFEFLDPILSTARQQFYRSKVLP